MDFVLWKKKGSDFEIYKSDSLKKIVPNIEKLEPIAIYKYKIVNHLIPPGDVNTYVIKKKREVFVYPLLACDNLRKPWPNVAMQIIIGYMSIVLAAQKLQVSY